ncbi:MAG: hypothetical protein NUW00_04895 [Candidatus Kaiserbacteria bacterium]|nr:hypothetical protein [Candidatus Kaiserbacteria bacterium]
MSPRGECRYFDYDYASAISFAGVDVTNATGDNRFHKVVERFSYVKTGYTDANPKLGKRVLWTRKTV